MPRTLMSARTLFFFALAAMPLAAQLRISQVYGAGGNVGPPPASFDADFVELFNAGASPVNIGTYSLQYASATSTNPSWTRANLPNVNIPAGGYYLVQVTAAGANGAAFAEDLLTGTALNMAAAAGKIALVGNQTTITAGTLCPTGLLDFVPWGTTNNCSPAAPATSTTTSIFRAGGGCTNTGNPSTDFTAAAAAPRNSLTALNSCGGSTNLSGIGAASPSSVLVGFSSLLTVTVTPATGPASSGIAVSADLSTAGGSPTQTFFDNGTNGDVTSGDNIFSFSLTVPTGTTPGAKTLPFTVTDAQARNAAGNISLTVTAPAVLTNINQIQGTGLNSPLVGSAVSTTGIVTGVRGDSFYLQNPESAYDANAASSEGILVFTGSGNVPPCAVVGNSVQVTGDVVEFVATASAAYRPPTGSASLTELINPTGCAVLSTGNPLPAPQVIDGTVLSATALTTADRWTQLERFEGMRVTAGPLSTTENSSSTTIFATLAGAGAPSREAGIQATKYPTGATVPFFDNNPEVFRIEGNGLNGTAAAFDLTYGSTVSSVTGILNYDTTNGVYVIRTTAAGVGTQTSSNLAAAPVPAPLPTDLTVVTMNAENFSGTDATKLAKASATIRNILLNPDIIGFQEIQSATALQNLADHIAANGGPTYSPAIFGAGTQRVAFLYRASKLQSVSAFEGPGLAANTYINPVNGASEPTFDRVPLILSATARAAGSDSGLPFTVVVNHAKSLIDVDNANETNASDAGRRNQAKRHAGARDTANLLQSLNTSGVHLVSVGDYNAYQFSDAYVDVIGCLRGVALSAQVFNPLAVASTAACGVFSAGQQLTNLTDLNPAARYSLMFQGNRQTLDHILVNNNALSRLRQAATAYVNSDYPRFGAISTNPARPERYADHNPQVAYFRLPMEVTSQVQVFASGLVRNRLTGRFTGTITVKNNSAAAIGAPVHVFFHGLPSGVTLVNATGTVNGVPYLTLNQTVAAGGNSTPAAVEFAVTSGSITYTTRTYSINF